MGASSPSVPIRRRRGANSPDLRDNVAVPEAQARMATMLKLNAETLHAIKQSLGLNLAALKRLYPEAELANAE